MRRLTSQHHVDMDGWVGGEEKLCAFQVARTVTVLTHDSRNEL